jgi:hypothetical protein
LLHLRQAGEIPPAFFMTFLKPFVCKVISITPATACSDALNFAFPPAAFIALPFPAFFA